jgi:flagellar basal body-associated protein FliL
MKRFWMRAQLTASGVAVYLALVSPATAKEEAPKPAPTIALESVALPIVVDGALLNYVFVSIKLELSPKADGAGVRAKEQYFRDDLVRYGHRTPFTRADDYAKVDEAKVKAEVMRAAVGFVGAGAIQNVLITKQMSQKILPKPQLARAKGPEIIP